MPPRPPRDPAKVGSFSELRSHYKQLWKELDECNRMKGATHEALRFRSGEVRGAKDEAIDYRLPDSGGLRWVGQVGARLPA